MVADVTSMSVWWPGVLILVLRTLRYPVSPKTPRTAPAAIINQ